MSKALNAQLFIVDPQNDFMGKDDGTPLTLDIVGGAQFKAALPVKGAVSDMRRTGQLVRRIGRRLSDIHVTLDSHRPIDVGHPALWRDQQGRFPAPYTIIRADDIRNGIWVPRNPALTKRMVAYAQALEAGGKYLLIVWPEHCIIGTWGHNVYYELMGALLEWERAEFANVDYIVKGTNPLTEHYGGLLAEVPDPNDPSTQLNTTIIQALQDADIVGIAGEASSHCVLTTVQQIVDHIGDQHLPKLVLLTDCMSPVPQAPGTPDFPAIAEAFLKDMERRGLRLMKSTDFLA